MWSPIIFFVEGLTYLVLALLLWKGRTPERIVAMALIALQWGSPLIDHLFIGQFRGRWRACRSACSACW